MLNRNAQYKEWLLPYLEGGLDDARRAQMEARLREDPALAAEAARLRRTVDGLRAAARQPRPDTAQVPRDLWPRLRAQLEERSEPAPTPARPAHAWWLTGVGATAAATLALAMIWLPGWRAPNLQDLHPQDRHPQASSLPPPGPGRPAGPPPATLTPATPPHASPALPPIVVPNPKTAQTQGTTPLRAAMLPAPAVSTLPASRTDPFAISPAPVITRNGVLKPTVLPGGPLTVKPAMPTTVRSLGMTASRPAARDGADTAAPGPLAGVFGSPALMPVPPVQDQPASPLRVTMAPPAPVKDQVQNGAAVKGWNEARAASPASNATGQAQAQPKSQGNLFAMIPLTTHRSAPPLGQGARQEKSAAKPSAPPSALENALRAQAMVGGAFGGGRFGGGGNAQGNLDTWQAALSAAVQAPLWGDTTGEQQANQALLAAKESGELDDLRARLEARRTQSPKDLVTGRMLAAVYEFGFSKESALHERQRVANMEGAVGEDWYALAQAEERAGSSEAARAAYRRALESAVPPSPYHAGVARARS